MTNKSSLSAHKTYVDPALPVFLVGIGLATTSFVFGLLSFPIFTKVCVSGLLSGVAKIGYLGIAVVFLGLMVEAFNLYEHHRRHVVLLIIVATTVCALGGWLMHFISSAYSCF